MSGIAVAALVVAGCLSATPKAMVDDTVGGDVSADGPAGADGTGDPGAPDDPGPQQETIGPTDAAAEEIEPDCGFQIASFTLQDERSHLRVGELAHFEASVPTDLGITVWFTADGVPAGAEFMDHGDGTADLGVNDQAKKSHTALVTVTLHAKRLDCELTRTKTVKVVGTVWATETGDGVVRVFRSDGASLGIGLPSGKTQQPCSLLELGKNRVLVGSFFQGGAEVYDLDGGWLYSFDTKDADGTSLFTSAMGARAAMLHAADGDVWLAGWDNRIVVFADDGAAARGRYKRTVDLDSYKYGSLTINSLVDLGGGKTVMVYDQSLPWSWMQLNATGDVEIEKFGNNSSELELRLAYAARAGDGLVVGGTVQQNGYVARVNRNGILEAKSSYLADFKPEYGLVALGRGVLVTTGQNGKIANSLVYFDQDLVPVVAPTFSGDKTGQYRGLMVLGGN